ncbi:hypothetical protein JVT61DRAFT_11813 [Boletus reticuloceps]|uniref:F-box domain-containing protein n=1 Tax=Boletus reticuloceps TaxID=495285 RepID=A0A8I3ABM7_9AGAM|nr:hypothetical protein JVT61DRAFT_11813 [Boletus reticuloceps]
MDNHTLTNAEALPRGKFWDNNPFLDPTGDSCPIHKLPVEVLSYLFEVVADDLRSTTSRHNAFTDEILDNHKPNDTSEFKSDWESVALTPWLPVSQVCRYWYDIAISTPSLWAVIHIPPWSYPPLPYIATQLERSKDHPIDIRIGLEYCLSLALH